MRTVGSSIKKDPCAGNTGPFEIHARNNLNSPKGERQDKAFSTLRAQFAMRGHALHRTSPADGPVSFYVERWGMVLWLPTLDEARRFLAQIGDEL